MLQSALSASIAGETVACLSHRITNPRRFGLRCGMLMSALLCTVNAALLRGGEKLLPQKFPAVLLAARWGAFGYCASLGILWACAASTLTAALRSSAGFMESFRLRMGSVPAQRHQSRI